MPKTLKFYWYPKCGTCRKAKKWLEERDVKLKLLNLVEDNPDAETIGDWVQKSGLGTRKFFNTSGQKYRELGLKNQLPEMTDEEMIRLLASDGKLIKRPVVTDGHQVTVGFREEVFETWLGL